MEDANKVTGFDGCFAVRLRELMKNAEITQKDLADKIGVTRQAISQYMDGSVQPNIEKLAKITAYFNVSSDYMLGKSDAMGEDAAISQISNKLGLSEKAIKILIEDKQQLYISSGRRDANSGFFVDFVNVFADIETIDVDDIELYGCGLFQDIMHYLQYTGISARDNRDDNITLAAYRMEYIPEEKRRRYKFHKRLDTISEQDLLSVYLFQIQKNFVALRKKLYDEKYFDDGGVAYRLKNKQIDDKARTSSHKFDGFNPAEAINQFESDRRKVEEKFDGYRERMKQTGGLDENEFAQLSLDDKRALYSHIYGDTKDKK